MDAGDYLDDDELTERGDWYRCDVCAFDSRDADLFDVDAESGTMVCAGVHEQEPEGRSFPMRTSRWGCEFVRTLGLPPSWVEWHDAASTRCRGECTEPVTVVNTWDGLDPRQRAALAAAEQNPDDAHDDAVDAALERNER